MLDINHLKRDQFCMTHRLTCKRILLLSVSILLEQKGPVKRP